MTAAAVGPLFLRGLPGPLWHRGCEQGNACPSLHSCPHPCTWGPGQTSNPVSPPHLFRRSPCVLTAPRCCCHCLATPIPAAQTLCPLSLLLPSLLPALHWLLGAGSCSAGADSKLSSKQRKITVCWAGLCCRSQALRGLGHGFFPRAMPTLLMPRCGLGPHRPQQTAWLLTAGVGGRAVAMRCG